MLPNSPENSGSVSLDYSGARWDGSVAYRYVEEFDWAAGVFVGTVPQYEVVNLSANYRISKMFGIGLDVSNALDNEHWESFGGDLMSRRALGSLSVNW